MKNNTFVIRNVKVFTTSFLLGSFVLSGCSEVRTIIIDRDSIHYEALEEDLDDITNFEYIKGEMSYQDIYDNIRIIKFRANDTEQFRLFAIAEMASIPLNGGKCISTTYYDLETGTGLIKYNKYYNDIEESVEYTLGEEIEILSEDVINDYFIEEKFIKSDYEISEILQFYQNKVVPQLEEKNKEKVKEYE